MSEGSPSIPEEIQQEQLVVTSPTAEVTPPDTISTIASASENLLDVNNEPAIEAKQKKEVPQERQRDEIKLISGTILNQEILARKKAVTENGSDGIKTKGDRALLTLGLINNNDEEGDLKSPVDLEADENQPAITIKYKGQEVTILNVTGRNKETFTGRILYKDNSSFPVSDISRSSLLHGFYKIEGEAITADMTDEAAKSVLQLHIDSIKSGTEIAQSDELNDLILKAAQERGILSPDDFLGYFLATKNGDEITDTDKFLQTIESLDASSNILLGSEVQDIVSQLKLGEEKDGLLAFIQKVALGEVPKDHARALVDAIKLGDLQKLTQAYLMGSSAEDAEQKRKELSEKLVQVGLGIAFLLHILFQVAKAETKAIKKSS